MLQLLHRLLCSIKLLEHLKPSPKTINESNTKLKKRIMSLKNESPDSKAYFPDFPQK